MRWGIALTDADRAPWLITLRQMIGGLLSAGQPAVLACSALKQAYRDRLRVGNDVQLVYLKGSYALIQQRLAARSHPYMNPNLLPSQFDALEEPENVPVMDVAQEPDVVVSQIKRALGLWREGCAPEAKGKRGQICGEA